MTTDGPVELVTAALEAYGCKPHTNGRGYQAKCPVHGGKDFDSMTITEGADGRVLLTCHSKSCSYTNIMATLGLTPADGFVRTSTADGQRVELKHSPREIVATYDYTDEGGELVFQVCRYGEGDGKTFRQRRPDGNGEWLWNIKGIDQLPLYNLPTVLAADPNERLLVVEGEKDVETLTEAGFTATTSTQGAGSAHRTDWSPLTGRQVVLIPDNDKSGADYADEVGAILSEVASD